MRLKYAMQTRMCSFDSTKAAGDVLESAVASTFNLRLLDRGPGHRSSARSREGRVARVESARRRPAFRQVQPWGRGCCESAIAFLALFEQYSDF
jgi:hypothetical protein